MTGIQTLQWLYVALMAAGAATFWLLSRTPKQVPGLEYMIALFIPVWSGAVYLAMAMGQGSVELAGRTVYYARYIDWVVTTPLLLLALALTAMYRGPKSKTLIAGLIGADVLMIVSGLVADLSAEPMRFVWFIFGCVSFLIILYMVWGPLRVIAKSRGAEHYSSFVQLATFLSILWVIYPAAWLIGPSGLGWVGSLTSWVLFTVVPFFSKVVFSFYDIFLLRKMSQDAPLVEKRPATEPF